MGWRNPAVPWRELERRLSDAHADDPMVRRPGEETAPPGDGGDSPAWSRKRAPYRAPAQIARGSRTPWAELHCHSSFSFLDGASHPEELAEEAVRLGLVAMAITDHDGLYGVVRFAEAARQLGLPTVFGSELTLGRRAPQTGVPDPGVAPDGTTWESHLVVLARDPRGYALLSRAISEAQLRGEKGAPATDLSELAAIAGAPARPKDRGHWLVLTGCRKGAVPRALVERGPGAAAHELGRLVDAFGREHVAVELWDHGDPLDAARNDALAQLAVTAGVELVVTGNTHYATPSRRPLATALAAVRARRSLDEMDGWLPAGAGAHLRSGDEQLRRFARYPGVVERTAELALDCAFDLSLVAPSLPPFPCPDGLDEMGYLRLLVEEGAIRRYGPRAAEQVPGAWAQIDHELSVVEQLGFAGYFLVVWDIVEFCRRSDIYCQGRGSAANSAICFAIGITRADAVRLGLLFERFLSPERDGPPDIDLDIESDRREEVIQYVYERHGRHHAAQVANVITYRARSALRDMAKALGYAPGQQDAWARGIDRWNPLSGAVTVDGPAAVGGGEAVPVDRVASAHRLEGVPERVVELASQVENFPRHLGIHSGGMVICDRPVIEVCPVEWARMEGRTVLQWDKDDCAAVGLVKFDLLGLGMLTALHLAVDMVEEAHGTQVDLAGIPQEDAVYEMLCRADTIGVFQVESRAQMATLPRLRPRNFYDLVVEVALIRPGPIQGGSVHPYIRRRNGVEPVTYLHPLLERSLGRTLGIPLFQEQLMSMAVDVAGFTAAEADRLRQAMGSKRSDERMAELRGRFFEGMAERGITGEVGERIWEKLAAFANFGFPESHSVSFAYLVYSSAWLKLHYPAAFCAALLNAQPMGFYSPHSLVQDARRHGVEVRTPDVNDSAAKATLVWPEGSVAGDPAAGGSGGDGVSGIPQPAVQLGLSPVRHLGDEVAERIVEVREAYGPFVSMEDFQHRVGVSRRILEALATAGAFGSISSASGSRGAKVGGGERLDRRGALWAAGAVARSGPDRLPGTSTGTEAPTLPGMTPREEAAADLWATGVSPDGHPTRFLRPILDSRGVLTAEALEHAGDGERVWVAGVVSHRQRPATAGGTTFVNLEDETGLVNVICSRGCWERYRKVARGAPALVVRGRLEHAEGVRNVIADRIEELPLGLGAEGPGGEVAVPASRDFR